MDFSRFGLINPLSDENIFRVHTDDFDILGRALVVGDVLEIPFLTTQDQELSFWEITDVDLKQEYEKFIAIIYATPVNNARPTREIPLEQTNDDVMDDIMANADAAWSEQVPVNDEVFDETPTPQPVDYRDPLQASFLDDITKEF